MDFLVVNSEKPELIVYVICGFVVEMKGKIGGEGEVEIQKVMNFVSRRMRGIGGEKIRKEFRNNLPVREGEYDGRGLLRGNEGEDEWENTSRGQGEWKEKSRGQEEWKDKIWGKEEQIEKIRVKEELKDKSRGQEEWKKKNKDQEEWNQKSRDQEEWKQKSRIQE